MEGGSEVCAILLWDIVVSVLKFQVKLDPPLHFILLYFPYFVRILNIFGVGGGEDIASLP